MVVVYHSKNTPIQQGIIYKPGPDLYIVDQLSQNNHTENKDQKITGVSINIIAINTSVNWLACMSIKAYRQNTRVTNLLEPKEYVIQGCSHMKEVDHSIR